jgi:hypothetical protein
MMPNFQLNENWGALFLVQVQDIMIIGRIQGEINLKIEMVFTQFK